MEILDVLGDVRDRPCLIIDDTISTGRTLGAAAAALERAGARTGACAAATHAVFGPGAESTLEAANRTQRSRYGHRTAAGPSGRRFGSCPWLRSLQMRCIDCSLMSR